MPQICDIDYSMLPDYMQDGARLYIERGILPGSFLQSVFSNDLVGAFATADPTNIKRLYDYADFLFNECPVECWGSRERVKAWHESKKA